MFLAPIRLKSQMKEVIWLFAVTVYSYYGNISGKKNPTHFRPYIHHDDILHRLLYQLAPFDFFFPTTCGKKLNSGFVGRL